MSEIINSIIIPFLGTVLGAACVFFIKDKMSGKLTKSFSGFAAGVMVSASVWGLVIPAMEQSTHLGKLSFIPVIVGLWLGFLFLMFLDKIIPHIHSGNSSYEGVSCNFKKSTMITLAVALHNLPEGMAVGVVLASATTGGNVSLSSALALAIGIAIQNFPEGAIISMPLKNSGLKSSKAFVRGALSGVVEPIGAVLTLALATKVVPLLPYLLSFAAGAMLYVVVEELIPEMNDENHSHIGTVFFAIGFSIMMILDLILG